MISQIVVGPQIQIYTFVMSQDLRNFVRTLLNFFLSNFLFTNCSLMYMKDLCWFFENENFAARGAKFVIL